MLEVKKMNESSKKIFEIIDEIKARGYEGTITKKVIETIKL